MPRSLELLLLCFAPMVWGSTYIVTTELLPQGYPLTAAVLRALPAGILLLLITRNFPKGVWFWRSLILGAFNFGIFLPLLFAAAYRLPGGVAGTISAMSPLMVVGLSWALLGQRATALSIMAGIAGVIGVALMVLTNDVKLDAVGVGAAAASALSLALGVTLTQKWRPPVSALTFTGWQMTAGGLLMVPVMLLIEPQLPQLSPANIAGFVYLGLIGGAASYFVWFRGIGIVGAPTASSIGLLSPVTAVLLGLLWLNQTLTTAQTAGMLIVIVSVWLGSIRRA